MPPPGASPPRHSPSPPSAGMAACTPNFALRKLQSTLAIADPAHDKSPKGSVDAPIRALVQRINLHPDFATTSSCSGRIAVHFDDGWLLSEHSTITCEQLQQACLDAKPGKGSPLLKAEPFLMHVLCRSLEAGQRLLTLALEAGFRESGLVTSKKVMLGIRTTSNAMQVPLSPAILSSKEVCSALVDEANARFEENARRTKLFEQAFAAAFPEPPSTISLDVVDIPLLPESPLLERWGHTASLVGHGLVFVFGGFRGGALLSEPVMLDAYSLELISPLAVNKGPSPRVGHCAVVVGDQVLITGGRASPLNPFSDCHAYSPATGEWRDVGMLDVRARWLHVAVSLSDSRVLLHGGRNTYQVLDDAIVVDTSTLTRLETSGQGPGPRFLHAAVKVGRFVVVHGGLLDLSGCCLANDDVFLLDCASLTWTCLASSGLGSRFAHSLHGLGGSALLALGGAGQQIECAVIIDLEAPAPASRKIVPVPIGTVFPVRAAACLVPGHGVLVVGGGCNCFAFGTVLSPSFSIIPAVSRSLYAKVTKNDAEQLRARLIKAGVLDKSRRAIPLDKSFMLLPVLDSKLANGLALDIVAHNETQISKRTSLGVQRTKYNVEFDRIDDVALLDDEGEGDIEWAEMARHYGVSRVVLRARLNALDGRRQSQAKILYPAGAKECWVRIVEHGVRFNLDLAKCMYSRGNVNEKQRFASLCRPGEVVVDLFAGIGYFTVVALVHSDCAVVHACEWNPSALEALRRNLNDNQVTHRCVVHAGDCRRTAAQIGPIAQRVSMGLLPQSWDFLGTALSVLSHQGGWLHVHGNTNDEGEWSAQLMKRLEALLDGAEAQCLHIERVKSFAPKVWHVVADVKIGPRRLATRQLPPKVVEAPAAAVITLARKVADEVECINEAEQRESAKRDIIGMFDFAA